MKTTSKHEHNTTITTALIVDRLCQQNYQAISTPPRLVVLWNDFSPQPDNRLILSLPNYIESNSERLRSKFVSCIDSLPDIVPTKCEKSIAQLLSLDDGFSLWWMNILSEKCNYSKSHWITDAVKCIALLEIISLEMYEIDTLDLRLENINLILILKSFASSNNISCLSSQSSINLSLQRLFRSAGFVVAPFRLMLRASAWFIIYFFKARHLSVNESPLHASRKPSVTIFSYLSSRQDFASSGPPVDPYWQSLPEIIHSLNYSINWIYIHSPDKILPNLSSAHKYISFLNTQHPDSGRHALLESFATCSICFRAYMSWLQLCYRVSRVLSVYAPQSSSLGFNLALFITRDWQTSIFGSTGLKNILYVYLFEAYFSSLSKQDFSLYLQENMNWEYAFIRAAKLHHSGCIIGFPHTIIRYWDLRYFYASKQSILHNKLISIRNRPQPDVIALCSEISFNLLKAGDCYSSRLATVEAIRYQHLNFISQNHSPCANTNQIDILMLGQYDLASTKRALQVLDQCLQLPSLAHLTFNIRFKPHPATPVDLSEYAFLGISLWTGSIASAAQVSQVAISPLQTAASLDLYLMGLNIVVIDDPTSLNLCPLREFRSYRKAGTSVELADQLLEIINIHSSNTDIMREEPYVFSSSLERWQTLFN